MTSVQSRVGTLVDKINERARGASQLVMVRVVSASDPHDYQYVYLGDVITDPVGALIITVKLNHSFD